MRTELTVAAIVLLLAGCSEQPQQSQPSTAGQATRNNQSEPGTAAGPGGLQGPAGPQGPPGPQGPAGPTGEPGTVVRFAEFSCDSVRCTFTCSEGERILNAYALGATGTLAYESDASVVYRQQRRGRATKIVLVCGRG